MFLLDSNVFMNASRLYYAPDIAPTFWEWLGNEHEKGNVASIVRVREEIDDGEAGHLTTWAASLPRTFWIKPAWQWALPIANHLESTGDLDFVLHRGA